MRKIAIAATTAGAVLAALAGSSRAAEGVHIPAQEWSFSGIFNTFDRSALRRGLQVYREVCANCHSLNFIAFRNLEAIGFTPEEVAEIASEYEVEDGPDDAGDMFMRSARAADRFPAPFANEQAARASNNGSYPPDLSLIAKWRAGTRISDGSKMRSYGSDYLYAVLTGYEEEPPEGVELMDGMYYNHYFPGHQIAMPPPLFEDGVEFADGTEATVSQQARDVTTFLTWAAQPELEARKGMGVTVLVFLLFLTALLYALKRKVWADVH